MDMLRDNVRAVYRKYFLAAFGSALISCIYGVVDMAMVGQYQGPDGTACIRLEGKYHLVHLSQELPLQFSAVPHARTTVKARVALESTGESVVPWTECTVLDSENWTITFSSETDNGEEQ